MQYVWFNVEKDLIIYDIDRYYFNMTFDCQKTPGGLKKIPKKVWMHFGANFKALRIENASLLSTKEFLNCLPYFHNLTRLDIVVDDGFVNKKLVRIQHRTVAPNNMKHLEHLRISSELFWYLADNCVDFAMTMKLRSIDFSMLGKRQRDLNKMRALISQQTNLKVLRFDGRALPEMFDQPLRMQSQLEDLAVRTRFYFNEIQQDNLCGLIKSQSLMRLDCGLRYYLNMQITSKMSQLLERRLDMPLITMTVKLEELIKEFNQYTLTDLQRLALGRANTSTTEMKFIDGTHINNNSLNLKIPLLVSKFPKLSSIEIVGSAANTGHVLVIVDSIGSLNELPHLKHFKLKFFSCVYLKDLNITNLESFEFQTNQEKLLRCDSNHLRDFLKRHQEIRTLHLGSITYASESNFDVLHFAVETLRMLMRLSITISNQADFYDVLPRYLIRMLIRDYTDSGFILDLEKKYQRQSMHFMKRHDEKVVVQDSVSSDWSLL